MKPPKKNFCFRIAVTCAVASLAVSAATLFLWHLDPAFLIDLLPGKPVLMPNSAFAIGLASLAVLLLLRFPKPKAGQVIGLVAGAPLIGLGAAHLVEAATGRRL